MEAGEQEEGLRELRGHALVDELAARDGAGEARALVDEVRPLVGLAGEEGGAAHDGDGRRCSSAFFGRPGAAAVTAEPMVALEVMRMKVMSAMNGMLKTSVRSGQGAALAWRRKRVAAEQAREEQGVGDDEDPHHRLLPARPEGRGAAAPVRLHRRRVRADSIGPP